MYLLLENNRCTGITKRFGEKRGKKVVFDRRSPFFTKTTRGKCMEVVCVGRVWCGWAVREWRVKECVVFLVGGWDGWGRGRQRQRAVVYREKDLTDRCLGEGSRGMW